MNTTELVNARQELGMQLRQRRLKFRISLRKIENRTGLTCRLIMNIEKGRTNYTIDSYMKYLSVLNRFENNENQ